jgi:hypothetical protein
MRAGKTHTIFAFLLIFELLPLQGWSQQTDHLLFSGKYQHIPFTSFLLALEEEYGLTFYYKNDWFTGDTINLNFENRDLKELLQLALDDRPYTYRIIEGNYIVFLPRDEVTLLTGNLGDFTGKSAADGSIVIIGDQQMADHQITATLTGRISDGKNGEPIIGAVVQVNNLPLGAVSNAQGNYKLTLEPGLYTLNISGVGYEQAQYNIKIVGDGVMNIELFDKTIALEDIVIYGQRLDRNVSNYQMSLVELDTRNIRQLPAVSGGRDILKGLTTMPGVKSVGEFSSGINVRGGGEDQNLYLFNNAPLFNTTHVFGLFSVINPDAVDRLSLYKGHIPASYGERVSSVLDIRTKESPPEKISIRGGIGIYDSRLMVEIPVAKNKVSIDLGGRTSYSNWLLKNMKDYNLRNSKASFYDLHGTMHVNLGKSRLAISGYTSYDEFRFTDEVKYRYGNKLGSLNWSYMFNSNLASYLTLAYSKYDVQKDDISSTLMRKRTESGIQYSSLKYRMKYGGLNHNTIDIGFNIIKYQVQPGIQNPLNSISLVVPLSLEPEQGYEGAVFLNDEFNVNEYLTINTGLRYSMYANTGPHSVTEYEAGMPMDTSNITGFIGYGKNKVIQSYQGFEPRLSARLKLNDVSSIKMSYNRNIQYLSLISYTSVSTPSDIWKLADTYIKPLISNQFAIGYYRNLNNNTVETSVEIYYKNMHNVIEYQDGAQLEMNRFIETQLVNATGRNYGVELLIKKNSGKYDGWISYTYSRSLRKTNSEFPENAINHNKYFPSSYDRPHDFTIVANYHLNRRVKLSANFSYSTGRPITLPEYKYFIDSESVVYFSDKNKYRIPDYHRLDLTLSVDESLKIRKKLRGSWSFSLLNVYGRKNPYTIFYRKEKPGELNDYNAFSLYKLYLIGRPIPTISYSFIF